MASSDLSNFQKFQQILTERPLVTVPENNVTESKLPAPIADSLQSGSASVQSASDAEKYHFHIVPFLRQTFRWDEELQRYVESREVPDEAWMVWNVITPDEKPGAWIRHQRRFDRLGVKTTDQLVVQAEYSTSNFLESFLTKDGDKHEEDSRYGTFYDAIIDESLFRESFFRYSEIKEEIATTSSDGVRRVLKILTEFLDYTFSDAREGYQDASRTGQVLFKHAWTLFRPGDIVYEKHTVEPYQEIYEQCFSVHSSEDSISDFDGTRVLCVTLAQMTHRSGQFNAPGPVMTWTTRCIRQYDGVKEITIEDLGLVPFNMMAPEKRDAIKATLVERARRFIQISKLPFSFWNYKGPYTIVHPLAGHGTIEEARRSLERRRWQKYTHENVVVDIATSNMHSKSRFNDYFENFHCNKHPTKKEDPRPIPPIDFSKDDPSTETLLLICRGYVPGYFLSSSVYAVGILISELRPPIWASQPLPSLTASLMPDTTHWRGLVHAFLGGNEDLEEELGRRQAQGSGLVLALEGPKIVARKIANEISGHLEKPLVCINILNDDLKLEETTKATLRWGAILFVEFRNMPSDQFPSRGLDLRNHASFYPSIMLISCNSTKELGNHCEEMIDSVISCRLPSKDTPVALWELAITEQTLGLSAEMSDERLCEIYRFLAQLEMRETRIEKILATAKRMAVTEKVQLSLQHVIAVIRLSVTPEKLGEFESVARMGMQKLGYN